MNCPKCGYAVQSGAFFCNRCGMKLTQQNHQPATKNPILPYLITASIVFFLIGSLIIYPKLRYETASFGRWDFKYDRFNNKVYRKLAFKEDAEWRETRSKNLRQAIYFSKKMEEMECQEAIEDALREQQEAIEEMIQEENLRRHVWGY